MSDLTPNDLSHLSDAEHNALAPQGYHAPGPATALSPAAQAVLDAVASQMEGGWISPEFIPYEARKIAAALRAAADQVVPHPVHPSVYMDCCEYSDMQTRAGIRADILAIAAELEGVGTNTIQED